MTDKRGTQCCAFGCNKRKTTRGCDGNQLRSCSEDSSDEESVLKRQFPVLFPQVSYHGTFVLLTSL